MRADTTGMRVVRDLAARVSPVFVPAGAWLMSGPAKPPIPRPWARALY